MNLQSAKPIRRIGLLSVLIVVCISPSQASSSEIVDQLKNCARMEHDANRITCYEQLGKSVLNYEKQPPVDTAASSSQAEAIQAEPAQADPTQADVLPDSLGGGQYADKAGRIVETNRGQVTSCKKASDRKWFYIFESGQVWKQVDSRKRRHKNCDFWVTITKDSFGYKMVIDGQDSKIRIDRRR